MINYKIDLKDNKLLNQFTDLEKSMPKIMRRFLDNLGNKIAMTIRMTKLSGQVLNAPTGNLKTSIMHKMDSNNTVTIGSFFKVYAAIHEFGGDIYPVNAKAFRFKIGQRWITTKHVRIPAKYYTRDTIEEFFNDGRADKLANIIIQQEIDKRMEAASK